MQPPPPHYSGHFNVWRQLLNGQFGEAACKRDEIFQGDDAGSSFPLSAGQIWQLLRENVRLKQVSELLSLAQTWSWWAKEHRSSAKAVKLSIFF